MKEVVITSAVRTAIGDFGGTLKDISCLELGKTVILEAMRRSKIEGEDVDEVIMGNVLPTGLGQNPARQAMLMAGLPVEIGALTINKVCGSGLKSVMLATQAIALGDADIIIAGGMENMYQAPYYLPGARSGYKLWDSKLVDGMVGAAETLDYLCREGKSEMVRLSAARAVLELGNRLRETVELEERIAALEGRRRVA